MKRVMYCDVKVNAKKGYFKLPPSPIMRKESNNFVEFLSKSFHNELNKMFKLKLNPEKENYFEMTEQFVNWFDSECNYELYQVFQDETLQEVYINKKCP